MLTIYRVMPTRWAIDYFRARTADSVPMLNEQEGDDCYESREAAIKCATMVTRNLNAPRDYAIVHVTYPETLHEQLAFSGDINGSHKDVMHAQLWKVTPKGAQTLNREAQMTMEILTVPEYHPASGGARQSN